MTNTSKPQLSLVPLGRERPAALAREAFNALVRWELAAITNPLERSPEDRAISAEVIERLRADTRALCDRMIAAGVVEGAMMDEPDEPTEVVARRAPMPADVDTSNACSVTLFPEGPGGRPGPWVSFATVRPGTLGETVINHLRPEQAINLAAWLFSVASASWATREDFRTLPSDIFARTLTEIAH